MHFTYSSHFLITKEVSAEGGVEFFWAHNKHLPNVPCSPVTVLLSSLTATLFRRFKQSALNISLLVVSDFWVYRRFMEMTMKSALLFNLRSIMIMYFSGEDTSYFCTNGG